MNHYDTVVIGAGITGLTLSYDLSKKGHKVLLVERGDRCGGAIRSVYTDNYLLEHGPNTVIAKPALQELVSDLKLQGELIVPRITKPKRYIAQSSCSQSSCSLGNTTAGNCAQHMKSAGEKYDYYLAALPSSIIGALASPLITVQDMFAILREPLRARTTGNDTSVAEFIGRRFSDHILQHLVSPFLSGIWAADVSSLSARSSLPLLWNLEQEHGSVVGGLAKKAMVSLFARISHKARNQQLENPSGKQNLALNLSTRTLISFRSGLETLANTLRDEIRASQAIIADHSPILYNTSVTELRILDATAPRNGVSGDPPPRFVVGLQSNHQQLDHQTCEVSCSNLVITTDNSGTQAILGSTIIDSSGGSHRPELDDLLRSLRSQLSQISYAPLGVIYATVPQSDALQKLDGFGFLVPPYYKQDILGAIFSSALFSGRAPDGQALITCFAGGATNPEMANADVPEIAARAQHCLGRMLHLPVPPQVLSTLYYQQAIPNYQIGHHVIEAQVHALETAVDGLYLRANWLKGISIADRITEARKLAALLCRSSLRQNNL